MCLKFLIFTLSRRAYCRRRSLDSKGLLSETHGFLCLISCLSRRFSKGLTTIETSNSCGGVHCRTILFWGVGQITRLWERIRIYAVGLCAPEGRCKREQRIRFSARLSKPETHDDP